MSVHQRSLAQVGRDLCPFFGACTIAAKSGRVICSSSAKCYAASPTSHRKHPPMSNTVDAP